MITRIKYTSLGDATRELKRMLNNGIACPEVRAKAIEVMVQGDEIASIFSWAMERFSYVEDPADKELFISPRRQLEEIANTGTVHGDCDDASLLVASLLGSVGYNTKIGLLDTDFDGEIDHAIACIETSSGWIDLDLTCKFPLGWVEQYSRRIDIIP